MLRTSPRCLDVLVKRGLAHTQVGGELGQRQPGQADLVDQALGLFDHDESLRPALGMGVFGEERQDGVGDCCEYCEWG